MTRDRDRDVKNTPWLSVTSALVFRDHDVALESDAKTRQHHLRTVCTRHAFLVFEFGVSSVGGLGTLFRGFPSLGTST
eukprot:3174405-Rhodomonas_salina.2